MKKQWLLFFPFNLNSFLNFNKSVCSSVLKCSASSVAQEEQE